jgi:Histidine phosphatase superfamily (branch 1)
MRLIFMRHPAVEFATLRCFGQTDVDLSFAGNSSLKPLAEEASGLRPEQVLSSDLKRCRLLAEQIADRLRITPVFDPIWREIDFGRGVGRRFRGNACTRRRVILATAETRLDRDIENQPDQLQRSCRHSCGSHPCGIFSVCEPAAFPSVRLQHPIRRNAPSQKGRPMFQQMLKIDFSREPRRLSRSFALPMTLSWPKIGRASLLASRIPAKARPFSKC